MFNRIRISTTLFLILILCGILQIGSNGMSFWAFRDDLQRLNQVEQSNQQRAALAQTRAVMLQASTALNKAGTLTALSYPADDIKTLMTTARASLTQSTTLFKSFMAMTAGNEHVRGLQKRRRKVLPAGTTISNIRRPGLKVINFRISSLRRCRDHRMRLTLTLRPGSWRSTMCWKPPVRKASVTIRFRHWCLSA
ncbi:methyl-accepting chemotaxis protein IV [Escherichia coli]|nr:methyl-accepting chemotaxis protein IV [Escherichia coli]